MITDDHQGQRVIDRAIEIAIEVHAGVNRRGREAPYVSHPIAVALLLAQAGERPAVQAAGVLHDVIEDAPAGSGWDEARLAGEVGSEVAAIVAALSKPVKTDSSYATWRRRNIVYFDQVRAAGRDAGTVSCADKTHNARQTTRLLDAQGPKAWVTLESDPQAQRWFYREAVLRLAPMGLTMHPIMEAAVSAMGATAGWGPDPDNW